MADTSGIAIIAMSGYFPIENQSILLDMSHMDGRIKKPFGISDLITELEGALNKKNMIGKRIEGGDESHTVSKGKGR